MNQKNPNPYSNYGYPMQQGGIPQYGQMQPSGQQPVYGTYPQQPMQQPMQYTGGPLEASGGMLVPAQGGQMPPASFKYAPSMNQSAAGSSQSSSTFVDNLLAANKGNPATVHLTFSSHSNEPNKMIKGIIVNSGRDHLILLNQETGTYYVILTIYLDYITFDEPIQM